MGIINFANRAHNNNFETDFIIRSRLDLDFYKLLMCQFIWKNYPDVNVKFSVTNRTKRVLLADGRIKEEDIRLQFDHVRNLTVKKSEEIWLQGNTFYGTRCIFEPAFITWFKNVNLPGYTLEKKDGQWVIEFEGNWPQTSLWEIYALAILNELRTRASLKTMTESELTILYAKATVKLWDKIEAFKKLPNLRLADFGTRRRHSYLWQEFVVATLAAELGEKFIGTSNVEIAFKHDLEAIGTNAHEIPTTIAALAKTDEELLYSPYKVLMQWQEMYHGALRIMLPDTFGTTSFFKNAPEFVADWTGLRIDSKDPFTAGDEYINFLNHWKRDPTTKLIIPSDGLDITTPTNVVERRNDIAQIYQYFDGRIKHGDGMGTNLTNDFRGCHPRGLDIFDPVSIVCKVKEVQVDGEWKSAVKMSDNYAKSIGTPEEIERYRRVFGIEGLENVPCFV